METQKKKRKSNILMIILIAVIAVCGVMAVGLMKGWFGGSDSPVVSDEITGVVNIERNGVGYSLEKGISLETDDIVETKSGSHADIMINKTNVLALNENTELKINESAEDSMKLEMTAGEVFADVPEAPENFQITFGESTAKITGTVFSISVQPGSAALNVYEGQVDVTSDGQTYKVKAGKMLSVSQQPEGGYDADLSELEAESLNEFIIGEAQECDSSDKLCFTQDELKKVIDDRAAERKAAEKAEGEAIAAEENGSSEDGDTSGEGSDSSSDDEAVIADIKTCTIQIRCDTILKNMDDLAEGKDRYVPSNGIILATSSVEFAAGETVFDVLKRACSYTGIPIEYSYTPMYESYYIEGINNLYEFDCGPQSGWMYKVNGWYPNYGCSSYTLEDGDTIVWSYTCKGLGADVR